MTMDAGSVTTRPAITVRPNHTVLTLAALFAPLFAGHGIKRVPIIKDSKALGILSQAAFVRALSRTPDAITQAE